MRYFIIKNDKTYFSNWDFNMFKLDRRPTFDKNLYGVSLYYNEHDVKKDLKELFEKGYTDCKIVEVEIKELENDN